MWPPAASRVWTRSCSSVRTWRPGRRGRRRRQRRFGSGGRRGRRRRGRRGSASRRSSGTWGCRARRCSAGCGSGAGRCSRAGNASTDCRARAHAIVAIDIRDVIRPGIFFDPSVIERRRVIDALPIDRYRELANIRGGREHGPGNGNHFATDTCSCPAGRKDSVSHAAGISVEHDVFNRADFFSLR